MDTSGILSLPLIAASQNQKHVTHNEAIQMLDAIVQLSVLSMDQTSAPGDPDDGARYIVKAGATGAWAGRDNQIAVWQNEAWTFYAANNGWVAWVEAETTLYAWQNTEWILAGGGISDFQNVDHVGIRATADDTNRLSLSSPASLFNHAGAGHQVKVNKNAAGDTASLLYQTNWSGRAEMGLAGDDDFSVKVSPDGASWFDAIKADRNNGIASFAGGVNSGTIIIGKDGVGTIDVAKAGGIFFLWAAGDPYPDQIAARYAMIFFDVGLSVMHVPINIDSAIGTGHGTTPTGTTGADGKTTIYFNTRSISIENRRSGSRIYRWLILG